LSHNLGRQFQLVDFLIGYCHQHTTHALEVRLNRVAPVLLTLIGCGHAERVLARFFVSYHSQQFVTLRILDQFLE